MSTDVASSAPILCRRPGIPAETARLAFVSQSPASYQAGIRDTGIHPLMLRFTGLRDGNGDLTVVAPQAFSPNSASTVAIS
jgi:hypothetical protein